VIFDGNERDGNFMTPIYNHINRVVERSYFILKKAIIKIYKKIYYKTNKKPVHI
jgi:hypothetical protein